MNGADVCLGDIIVRALWIVLILVDIYALVVLRRERPPWSNK